MLVPKLITTLRDYSRAQFVTDLGAGVTVTPLYTQGRKVPKGVQIYAIDGPFFFGAAEKFKDTLTQVAGKPRVILLLMRNVSAIDSTGLRALQEVVKRFRSGGTDVLLVGVHAQPMVAIARAGLIDRLGEDNLVGTIDDALERAGRLMDKSPPA